MSGFTQEHFYSPELEKALLGAILETKSLIRISPVKLGGHHFYNENHREIYEVCQELEADQRNLDPILVAERLARKKSWSTSGGIHT